jgi:hypothetical protein
MKCILPFLFFYFIYTSSAIAFDCEKFNKSIKDKEFLIPGHQSGRVAIGSGRLYFYSAPVEECKIKDLFIVSGDQVDAYSDFGKYTFIQYISNRLGDTVDGWVYTDRLKATGYGIAPDKDAIDQTNDKEDQALKEQEQKNSNPEANSQLVESTQSSIIGQWDCSGEDKKFTFDQNGGLTMDAINSGQHMYLHGSYAQSNANIKMTYNSIGNNSRNVPLPSPQYDKAQILSPDKLAVITSDAKTGEDYPPYYCNKTTASTSSARSPAPTINQEGDAIERYANSLASQLENSSLPACQMIASNIRQFGSSGSPDNVKKLQVDAIFDKAPSVCFQ